MCTQGVLRTGLVFPAPPFGGGRRRSGRGVAPAWSLIPKSRSVSLAPLRVALRVRERQSDEEALGIAARRQHPRGDDRQVPGVPGWPPSSPGRRCQCHCQGEAGQGGSPVQAPEQPRPAARQHHATLQPQGGGALLGVGPVLRLGGDVGRAAELHGPGQGRERHGAHAAERRHPRRRGPGRREELLGPDRQGGERRGHEHHAEVRRGQAPRRTRRGGREAERDLEQRGAGVAGRQHGKPAPGGHGEHHVLGLRLQAHGLQDVPALGARADPPQGQAGRVRGGARRAVLDAAGLLRQAAARRVPRGRGGLCGRRHPGVLLPQRRDTHVRHSHLLPHERNPPVLRGLGKPGPSLAPVPCLSVSCLFAFYGEGEELKLNHHNI